jgi:ABC-type multidrug transport system ATPase subunit
MPRGAILEVTGLRKRFDGKTVLDGLTFALKPAEVLGLLGPNGAGKTTTFLCLAGLLRPDGGTIAYGGVALGEERSRTISLIPETPDVYPMLTVWEHLAFVARGASLDEGWQERAEGLIDRFGLTSKRTELGQALSKGMRQKTLIAATVLADAPVILFDEPMVGLDPHGQRELRELISALAASGTAVVISTHLIDTAAAICDRIIIMKDGKTVAEGAVAELNVPGRSLEDAFFESTR